MTINLSDNSPRNSYTVNQGATASTFEVQFAFFDNDDLNVYVDGTLKTLTTHYTTSDDQDNTVAHVQGEDGYIHFTSGNAVTGASGGSTVVITRDIDLNRVTDFPTSGPFDVASLNTELDRMIAIAADIDDASNRALILSDFDTTASLTLPDVTTRASKQLGFDGNGNLVAEEGKVSSVSISASGLSAGASPSATASFTASSGALALALGIPAGATGQTGPAGGGLADLSADTTPQLGGNLDMNGKDIVTTSNATIDLAPHGTGTVVVRGNTNSGTIVFNCEDNSHGQTVKAQPHSASVTNTMLLPAGADSTLVSLVSTDTLSNKTLNGVTVALRAVGHVTTDNDGSFDLAVGNDFKCTTAGGLTLTFTNPVAGQSGNIMFINGGNHTIAAHASVAINADVLTAISATGTYHLAYYCSAASGNNTILVSGSAILT